MCPHAPFQATNDYELPSAEAVLAGTLALMTGYAQSPDDEVRQLMAHKVISNLQRLTEHPHLTDAFRTMLGQLGGLWRQHLAGPVRPPGSPAWGWHDHPGTLQ